MDRSADEKNASAYKSFCMLLKHKQERLEQLSVGVWTHWLYILFGPFDNDDIQNSLIAKAYEKCKQQTLEMLESIFRYEIDTKDYSSLLSEVETIWDEKISQMLHSLLSDAEVNGKIWGKILETVVAHGNLNSIRYAQSKLKAPFPRKKQSRDLCVLAAVILAKYTENASWTLIWNVISRAPVLGQDLILGIAYDCHHSQLGIVAKLKISQVEKLYLYLSKKFTHSTDPIRTGAYSPNSNDAVRKLRNDLITYLKNSGTIDGVKAIERIVKKNPQHDWLLSVLAEARENTMRANWIPLLPDQFLRLIADKDSRLIRSALELQQILFDKLIELEQIIQGETPAVYDLWNEIPIGSGRKRYQPKDENHLSDWIKRQLEMSLNARGIVCAREVEIRRASSPGTGQRTDIHVTASIPEISTDTFKQVRVIIEAKGCWHREIKTAMKNQLKDRYLKNHGSTHGIYLIGWYLCESWDENDYRKRDTPKWAIKKARSFFSNQAESFSDENVTIESVVINTSL